MRKVRFGFLMVVAFHCSAIAQEPAPLSPAPVPKPAPAKSVDRNAERVATGRAGVEEFFGAPFPRDFAVAIVPHRADFDAALKQAYDWPPSQCWMVATGIDKGLTLLDPTVWKTDACEHDGNDEAHVQGIVTHELVHVYHGQRNPTGDFTGMDDLGWFVEGIAVYASGQLDREHKDKDREALAKRALPGSLATAWSGRYRYAVCGSLVRYLDEKLSRAKLVALLVATTPAQFFELAGIDESTLLADWREWVMDRDSGEDREDGCG